MIIFNTTELLNNEVDDDETQKQENKCIQRTAKYCEIIQILKPIVLHYSSIVSGDILTELNEEEGHLKGFNILHYVKPTLKVEKTKHIISFHLKMDTDSFNPNLDQVATTLSYQPNQLSHYFANLLFQYLQYLENIKPKVECLISLYQPADQLDRLVQERQFYIRKYMEQIYFGGTNKPTHDLIAWYTFSFKQKSWNLLNIAKSKKLINFLGADCEQIERIALKKGRLNMFTLESRIFIQAFYLEHLLNRVTEHRNHNFQIQTYDGIVISCPIVIKIVPINLPSHLLYPYETERDSYEIIIHSVFDLTSFHYQVIQSIRNSDNKYTRFIQEIDEDFEYTVQSEILLQKFYRNEYDEFKAREENIQVEQQEVQEMEESKITMQ